MRYTNFLQNFYRVLKGVDEHLRFVFMTGIIKFAKVLAFSALNNLLDITFDAAYATLCGYTQEELELCFVPHLEELAAAHQLVASLAVAFSGRRIACRMEELPPNEKT